YLGDHENGSKQQSVHIYIVRCEWFWKTCEDFPGGSGSARVHDIGGNVGCCCRQDLLVQVFRRRVGGPGAGSIAGWKRVRQVGCKLVRFLRVGAPKWLRFVIRDAGL